MDLNTSALAVIWLQKQPREGEDDLAAKGQLGNYRPHPAEITASVSSKMAEVSDASLASSSDSSPC
jgi:hypothetical protein